MVIAKTIDTGNGSYKPAVQVYSEIYTTPNDVAPFRRHEDAIAHATALQRCLDILSWSEQKNMLRNMQWVRR